MSTSKPVITVLGSYAVGMTMCTERFPTCGETLLGKNFQQMHGGKGSNQAIEAARLGAQTNFCGCVGKDVFGDSAIALFQQEGIHYDHVKRSALYPTGVGFINVDKNGNNIITIDFGANNDLSDADIEPLEDLIAKSDILLIQLEIALAAVECAARLAKKNGVKVILNPAPFQPISDELIKNVDIMTPNETEAKLLLNLNPELPVTERELAEAIYRKGASQVVVTLGERGAYIFSQEIKKVIPAREVTAIDSTGAGDTFSAALAVAIAEGNDLENAVKFANTAAGLSVTKYGVVTSLPYRQEVERYLAG